MNSSLRPPSLAVVLRRGVRLGVWCLAGRRPVPLAERALKGGCRPAEPGPGFLGARSVPRPPAPAPMVPACGCLRRFRQAHSVNDIAVPCWPSLVVSSLARPSFERQTPLGASVVLWRVGRLVVLLLSPLVLLFSCSRLASMTRPRSPGRHPYADGTGAWLLAHPTLADSTPPARPIPPPHARCKLLASKKRQPRGRPYQACLFV